MLLNGQFDGPRSSLRKQGVCQVQKGRGGVGKRADIVSTFDHFSCNVPKWGVVLVRVNVVNGSFAPTTSKAPGERHRSVAIDSTSASFL